MHISGLDCPECGSSINHKMLKVEEPNSDSLEEIFKSSLDSSKKGYFKNSGYNIRIMTSEDCSPQLYNELKGKGIDLTYIEFVVFIKGKQFLTLNGNVYESNNKLVNKLFSKKPEWKYIRIAKKYYSVGIEYK